MMGDAPYFTRHDRDTPYPVDHLRRPYAAPWAGLQTDTYLHLPNVGVAFLVASEPTYEPVARRNPQP